MIDDRIGSIGSTHGVSDSSTPARKNTPTTVQNRPPRRAASMPALSVELDVVEVGAAAAALEDNAAPEDSAPAPPAATRRTDPSPPNPLSPTSARDSRGG